MSWYFYLYAVLFAIYPLYSLKMCWFSEDKAIGQGAINLAILLLAALVFSDYAGWTFLPYQWLVSAIAATVLFAYVVYNLAEEFSSYYLEDEDEDEDDCDEDEAITQQAAVETIANEASSAQNNLKTLSPEPVYNYQQIATQDEDQSATLALNIDQYRPVHNPAEIGEAIGQIFSGSSSKRDVLAALSQVGNAIEDDEIDDEDEDKGSTSHFIGTTLIFIWLFPALYIAWLVMLRNTQPLF